MERNQWEANWSLNIFYLTLWLGTNMKSLFYLKTTLYIVFFLIFSQTAGKIMQLEIQNILYTH